MNYLKTTSNQYISVCNHSDSNSSTTDSYCYVKIMFQYWYNNVTWTQVAPFLIPTIASTAIPTIIPTNIPTSIPTDIPTSVSTATTTIIPTIYPALLSTSFLTASTSFQSTGSNTPLNTMTVPNMSDFEPKTSFDNNNYSYTYINTNNNETISKTGNVQEGLYW